MTALGYRIGLDRNVRKPWQAGVEVSIGGTSPYVPNHIGLEFDPDEDHGSERREACVTALEALIDVADPDSGVITSTGFRGLTTPPYLPLGWITYLSDRLLGRRAIPTLPAPATVTRRGSGWLLQLTEEWFEHERTDHRGIATAAIAGMRKQLPDLEFVVRTRPTDAPRGHRA